MNRKLLSSWARLHRRAVAPDRSAGTVMLLVVGVLLLVLIVGMTYMHVVQEDRRAGLTVDIDAIVLAQADLAATKLLEDLSVGATGQHFADIHTNGTTNNTPDGLPDQEPYDYPGDVDKWLAATSPEATGTVWAQVSLLGEGFWNGTNSTDTTRTLAAATAVGASKASNGAADADGDGIMDSKPEQAAVYSRGGLLFFGWARIEDMSSKMNINVVHSQVSNTGAYNATTNAPRWWYPGELDLGAWANTVKAFDTQYTNVMTADLPGLMSMRGVNTALPTPWGTAAGYRGHSWLLNAKFYDNPQAPYAAANNLYLDSSGAFDPTNELELRHRNGLVYLDNEAPIEATGRARNLLRGTVTSAESAWDDSVPGVTTIANYFAREPRHQLTTYNGASILRMPMSGDTSTPFWGKRDINVILTGANPAAALSTEISRVYGAGSPPLPAGVANATQFADQFATNIIDYADDDNVLTVHNGRYGMEALPFITEIYSQYAYEVTAATGTAPNWSCTIESRSAGYAVEIRNPSNKAISLENVRVVVDGAVWGTLDTLAAGATNLPADGKLPPDRPLIFYKDGVSAHGTMSPLFDASQTPITKALANNWASQPGAFAWAAAELQVLASDATWVTYQKFTIGRYNNSFSGTRAVTDASDPTGNHFILGTITKGNGDGINMMTVTEAMCSRELVSLQYNARTTTSVKLGVANKGNLTAPSICNDTATQLLLADRADLSGPALPPIVHVGELLHIGVFGPTSTQTIAEVWGSNTSMDAFTVKPDSASVVAGSVDYQVPHAILLADRFTTLSPREDGVDNDGDGTVDESDELLVPGKLNLNTAPPFTLNRALPFGSAATRQAYMLAIVDYRDAAAGSRPGTHRAGRKGIAYPSEVYNLGTLAASNDIGQNAVDDFSGTAFGSIQSDFLSNPPTGADTVIDDLEEKSLVARWLGQVCSTRSDVYCAYILVRGYSPGNLTTPVTERRAAVLLDRSRVATQDDGVRVLGIIWY